jgi:hypothetical protein
MTYKTAQLVAVLQGAHNPALAKQPGMVYQVWEDGEITLQKSGTLLWQRTLHSIVPGLHVKVPPTLMPEQSGKAHEMHGYAFVTEDDAKIIRDMIENLEDRPEWNPPPKPVNEGPLNLLIYDDQATAELAKSYLVGEFPMAKDGKLEVNVPTEGYWAEKGVWEVRFPSGHDHWLGYKNTFEKMQSAARDFERGYKQGYKQGQIDEAHAAVLRLTKRELSKLAKLQWTKREET